MLRFTLKFPIGVYFAKSAHAPEEPEWPPSPVRLIGALLAAAHGSDSEEIEADLEIIERLAGQSPPHIVAPRAASIGTESPGDAVALRGPSRWAPKNGFDKKVIRSNAAVEKVGVAIGDQPLSFVWPDLELGDEELSALKRLATDITHLGATRSPVIARVSTEPLDGDKPAWVPLDPREPAATAVSVRVPDAGTVPTFDARFELFKSTNGKVQRSTMVPSPPLGYQAPYAFSDDLEAVSTAFDPRWWGDMIVVPLDTSRSETVPRAAGSYLLARAMRVALLGAFEDEGEPGEAPAILRGHGADPHCAIVPLADVFHEHSSGRVMGIAILLPSPERVPDLDIQRHRLETGLGKLLRETDGTPQRFIQIPGAGKVWLQAPNPAEALRWTLNPAAYRGASKTWTSITPVVHSRWQKPKDGGLLDQVRRDCSHVGLPAPEAVDLLRGPGRPGGAPRPALSSSAPERWRQQLNGPIDHIRITFPTPVVGPILLGRARHFGLGLCIPEPEPPQPKGSTVEETQ